MEILGFSLGLLSIFLAVYLSRRTDILVKSEDARAKELVGQMSRGTEELVRGTQELIKEEQRLTREMLDRMDRRSEEAQKMLERMDRRSEDTQRILDRMDQTTKEVLGKILEKV